MLDIQKEINRKGSNLLKGSDLAKKDKQITIEVVNVRRAPETFTGLFIVDCNPVTSNARTGWAVNSTNAAILRNVLKSNDLETLNGKLLTLEKIKANNPKKKDSKGNDFIVDSLQVLSVKTPKTKIRDQRPQATTDDDDDAAV